jgi:hypothetical protein
MKQGKKPGDEQDMLQKRGQKLAKITATILHFSDSTLTAGEIGVAASDTSDPTEVLFNNAEVWAL